jgi:YHS domain-containing protein
MARNPVCGMQVNEQQAAGTSEYQGDSPRHDILAHRHF